MQPSMISSNNGGDHSQATNFKAGSPSVLGLCVAIYDYSAQGNQELSVSADDILEILSFEGQWWLARAQLKKEIGFVPYNYVDLVEDYRLQNGAENDETIETDKSFTERISRFRPATIKKIEKHLVSTIKKDQIAELLRVQLSGLGTSSSTDAVSGTDDDDSDQHDGGSESEWSTWDEEEDEYDVVEQKAEGNYAVPPARGTSRRGTKKRSQRNPLPNNTHRAPIGRSGLSKTHAIVMEEKDIGASSNNKDKKKYGTYEEVHNINSPGHRTQSTQQQEQSTPTDKNTKPARTSSSGRKRKLPSVPSSPAKKKDDEENNLFYSSVGSAGKGTTGRAIGNKKPPPKVLPKPSRSVIERQVRAGSKERAEAPIEAVPEAILWSTDECIQWFEKNKLGHFAPKFSYHRFNGSQLALFDEKSVRFLGAAPRNERRRLLDSIKKLFGHDGEEHHLDQDPVQDEKLHPDVPLGVYATPKSHLTPPPKDLYTSPPKVVVAQAEIYSSIPSPIMDIYGSPAKSVLTPPKAKTKLGRHRTKSYKFGKYRVKSRGRNNSRGEKEGKPVVMREEIVYDYRTEPEFKQTADKFCEMAKKRQPKASPPPPLPPREAKPPLLPPKPTGWKESQQKEEEEEEEEELYEEYETEAPPPVIPPKPTKDHSRIIETVQQGGKKNLVLEPVSEPSHQSHHGATSRPTDKKREIVGKSRIESPLLTDTSVQSKKSPVASSTHFPKIPEELPTGWKKVRNANGNVSLKPPWRSADEKPHKLKDLLFYHGVKGRDWAETLLDQHPPGTYLVRNSTNRPEPVVSVHVKKHVFQHLRIRVIDGKYALGGYEAQGLFDEPEMIFGYFPSILSTPLITTRNS